MNQIEMQTLVYACFWMFNIYWKRKKSKTCWFTSFSFSFFRKRKMRIIIDQNTKFLFFFWRFIWICIKWISNLYHWWLLTTNFFLNILLFVVRVFSSLFFLWFFQCQTVFSCLMSTIVILWISYTTV